MSVRYCLNLYHTIPAFIDPNNEKKTIKKSEKNVEMGERDGNQHVFLFLQCFVSYQGRNLSYWAILDLSFADAFRWTMDQSEIPSSINPFPHNTPFDASRKEAF